MNPTPPLSRRRFCTVALSAVALVATGCASGSTSSASDDTAAGCDEPTDPDQTASSGTTPSTTSPTTSAGDSSLFDGTVIHTVEMSFDEAEYDAMIATLAESGTKEWIETTVTIDGVTYERAGARLKGNSSLAGLSGGGPGGGGGDGGGSRAGGGGPGGSASADEPEGLPWLIRLDYFVEGQEHDGYVDIVIRSNTSSTSLNEAVALDLLDVAGLASQDAAHVGFSVNGGVPTLRLMIEHPSDDAWQDANFSEPGALYKAESTGDWSYRGDDQDAYDDVFDQEGGKKVTDLTPLIGFLRFIQDADDATFADELPSRLDVDAFATYLAMMELVENADDIDGPGNNAYLWWDAGSEQFTVVPWDMNLAFGGLGDFGGGRGGEAGRERPTNGEPPEGFEPGDVPEDVDLPQGFEPGQGGPGPGGDGGPGGFGRSNPLVERFLADAGFSELYAQALTDVTTALVDGGTAASVLEDRTAVLLDQATDLVGAEVIAQESDAIAQSLNR